MSERFDDVVRNAFDFLRRSIDELQQHPKHSVIHFYSAIELFVKARLLKEHWTLIVSKPELADKARFQRGDFQSVGLKEANERLTKVAADGLQDDELKCFDGLRQERNQMVHFAHLAGAESEEAQKAMDRIVSDHAQGWLHLRRLLMGRWEKHFSAYIDTVKTMDGRMREQTKSLERKFMLLEDEIAAAKAAGRHFMDCPSCGFESFEVELPVWVGEAECLTCGLSAAALALDCVDGQCGKPIILSGSGYEWCPECDHKYSPEQVAKVVEDADLIQVNRPQDGDPSVWANCGECEGYDTVGHLRSGHWFCTECFMLFDETDIENCDWCGSPTSSLSDESMVNGCSQCGGYAGHMADKDD